jgi:membrane protein YdbS with pleckstrin-like domain
MLNEKERLFVDYWQKHRAKEKNFVFQLLTGLPVGLLFALPIMFILITSKYWFKRADMVANSQMNISAVLGAVFFISIFVAVLYKRHQWEMKEQQYNELKRRDKSPVAGGAPPAT